MSTKKTSTKKSWKNQGNYRSKTLFNPLTQKKKNVTITGGKNKKMNKENKELKRTKITITLPTNAYFMSGIRDFTLTMIKNTTNFPEKWAFRFQSVVDELCNNAIEYGSSPGSEIRITFLHIKEEHLEISVEDTGTGANAMNAEGLNRIFQERRETGYVFTGIRGRGLVKIVGEWTDEINFEDRKEGGIRVTVKKFLDDPRRKTEEKGLKMEQKI
jgi:anti-sigma regulatory factor (Ser/Thr protein kinase)